MIDRQQVLRSIANRDQRDLVRRMLTTGWRFDRYTGSGHLRLVHASSGSAIICARTLSDQRGIRNLRGQVRRIERRDG